MDDESDLAAKVAAAEAALPTTFPGWTRELHAAHGQQAAAALGAALTMSADQVFPDAPHLSLDEATEVLAGYEKEIDLARMLNADMVSQDVMAEFQPGAPLLVGSRHFGSHDLPLNIEEAKPAELKDYPGVCASGETISVSRPSYKPDGRAEPPRRSHLWWQRLDSPLEFYPLQVPPHLKVHWLLKTARDRPEHLQANLEACARRHRVLAEHGVITAELCERNLAQLERLSKFDLPQLQLFAAAEHNSFAVTAARAHHAFEQLMDARWDLEMATVHTCSLISRWAVEVGQFRVASAFYLAREAAYKMAELDRGIRTYERLYERLYHATEDNLVAASVGRRNRPFVWSFEQTCDAFGTSRCLHQADGREELQSCYDSRFALEMRAIALKSGTSSVKVALSCMELLDQLHVRFTDWGITTMTVMARHFDHGMTLPAQAKAADVGRHVFDARNEDTIRRLTDNAGALREKLAQKVGQLTSALQAAEAERDWLRTQHSDRAAGISASLETAVLKETVAVKDQHIKRLEEELRIRDAKARAKKAKKDAYRKKVADRKGVSKCKARRQLLAVVDAAVNGTPSVFEQADAEMAQHAVVNDVMLSDVMLSDVMLDEEGNDLVNANVDALAASGTTVAFNSVAGLTFVPVVDEVAALAESSEAAAHEADQEHARVLEECRLLAAKKAAECRQLPPRGARERARQDTQLMILFGGLATSNGLDRRSRAKKSSSATRRQRDLAPADAASDVDAGQASDCVPVDADETTKGRCLQNMTPGLA